MPTDAPALLRETAAANTLEAVQRVAQRADRCPLSESEQRTVAAAVLLRARGVVRVANRDAAVAALNADVWCPSAQRLTTDERALALNAPRGAS